MKNSLKTTKITFGVLLVIVALLIGLAAYITVTGKTFNSGHKTVKATPTEAPSPSVTEVPVKTSGDMTCDAVVLEVNTTENIIRAYLPDYDITLELSYTGGTDIRNSFDRVISATTLETPAICEVSYDAADNRLYHLYLTQDYWSVEAPESWSLNLSQGILSVGDMNYRVSQNVATVSDDGDYQVSRLSMLDTINIYGRDQRVYVIELVEGHGTVFVMNETAFVGGSIYVDNVYAGQICEGYALSIKEGDYEISFSNGDLNGKEEVTVGRNDTVILDMAQYSETVVEYGYVDFRITPDEAELYIDNFMYDYNDPIKLSYGTHYVEVTCSGYVSYGYTITVGSENMKLTIDLARQFEPTATPTPDAEATPVPDEEIEATPTPDPDATATPTPDPDATATPVPDTDATATPAPDTDATATPAPDADATATPLPTATPTPDPNAPEDNTSEQSADITLYWYPSSVVTVDGIYAGITDGSGILELTVSYGKHVVGLTRTTLDGTTQPKNYTVTVDSDTSPYISFPTS